MAYNQKDGDNGVAEFQFYAPENRTRWQSIRKAIYDKSSNQIFGRTPKNWGQLLLFYSIFYVVLAALFAICMQGLFATLDDRSPRWTLEQSLIGVNPGLGFRPISTNTDEGSLIWYNKTNHTTITKWIDLVNRFLEPYQNIQTGAPFVNCNFDKHPQDDQVCVTNIENLGNCNPERLYGYNTSSPCVFLKLNRIYNWIPQYYTAPVHGMPDDLVTHINDTLKSQREQVWVSCNGVNDFDQENIKGFKYYPHGFASYYYPYKNAPHYLSPIVAVEILNVKPNVIVSIECRAWAGNIEYHGGSLNRAGSVTFEIQVDAETHISEQNSSSNSTINHVDSITASLQVNRSASI